MLSKKDALEIIRRCVEAHVNSNTYDYETDPSYCHLALTLRLCHRATEIELVTPAEWTAVCSSNWLEAHKDFAFIANQPIPFRIRGKVSVEEDNYAWSTTIVADVQVFCKTKEEAATLEKMYKVGMKL